MMVAPPWWPCRVSRLLMFTIVVFTVVRSAEVFNFVDDVLATDPSAVRDCQFEPDIPSARVDFPANCDVDYYDDETPSAKFHLESFVVQPIYQLDADGFCQSYLSFTWWSWADVDTSNDDASSQVNEGASLRLGENTRLEANEDWESSEDWESATNITTGDRTNDVLTFRLYTLGLDDNLGAKFCTAISMSSSSIVNRSLTFSCLKLRDGRYTFSLHVEKTLEDGTIQLLGSKSQNTVEVNSLNQCRVPKDPGLASTTTTPLPAPLQTESAPTYKHSYLTVIVVVSVVAFLLTLILVVVLTWKIIRNRRDVARPSPECRSLVTESSQVSIQVENPCQKCATIHGNPAIVPP